MLFDTARLAILGLKDLVSDKEIDKMIDSINRIKNLKLDSIDEKIIYATMIGNYYANSSYSKNSVSNFKYEDEELSGIRLKIAKVREYVEDDLNDEREAVITLQVGRTLYNFITSNKNINVREFIDLPEYICNGAKIKLVSEEGDTTILEIW